MSELKPLKPIKLDDELLAVIQNAQKELPEMEKKYKSVPDVETDDGYAKAKKEAKLLKDCRIKLENARADYTKPLYDQKKTVDTLVNGDLVKRFKALESARTSAIAVVDQRAEKIAAEAKAVEDKRLADIEAMFQKLRDLLQAITLEDVIDGIEHVDTLDLQPFQERAEEAEDVAGEVLETLTKRRSELQAQKDESDRLAAEAKKQAEAAEALRKEREAMEAEKAKIEAEKQQAESERRIREQAEQEKKEAAERAERDKEAAIVAERERIEAETKAAEEKRIAEQAEKDRLAAMAPDADKLRVWLDCVSDVPKMSTKEGKALASRIDKALSSIGGEIDAFQDSVKTEAA